MSNDRTTPRVDEAMLETARTLSTYEVYLIRRELLALRRENEAMRAVLMDVAAMQPFCIQDIDGRLVHICPSCGRKSKNSLAAIHHMEGCLWQRARALLGQDAGEGA